MLKGSEFVFWIVLLNGFNYKAILLSEKYIVSVNFKHHQTNDKHEYLRQMLDKHNHKE